MMTGGSFMSSESLPLSLYNKIKSSLSNAGVYAPAFEAFIIFEEVIGKKYINATNIDITDEKINQIENMLKKRAKHYPLQYILGYWDFWNLHFKIGEGVLIPRADTETLVELALSKIKNIEKPVIVDLCSGSGCIAISVATERPDAIVYAVEKSKKAFEYLNENIKINNAINVKPILADVLNKCIFKENLLFNLILSNPPYIQSKSIKCLQKEVMFEPKMALDGGDDGLYFYKNITEIWFNKLKNNGVLAFEIGYNQFDKVKTIMESKGLVDIKYKKDLNGISRVIYGNNAKSY